MTRPTAAAVAKAKGDILAALHTFRASCRSRQARCLALLRELAKEHDRDANALYRADRRFVRAVDPEDRLQSSMRGDLFVNWSPGAVEIPDRDYLSDTVPSGDIDDALDDVATLLAEAKELYAPDDDAYGPQPLRVSSSRGTAGRSRRRRRPGRTGRARRRARSRRSTGPRAR